MLSDRAKFSFVSILSHKASTAAVAAHRHLAPVARACCCGCPRQALSAVRRAEATECLRDHSQDTSPLGDCEGGPKLGTKTSFCSLLVLTGSDNS